MKYFIPIYYTQNYDEVVPSPSEKADAPLLCDGSLCLEHKPQHRYHRWRRWWICSTLSNIYMWMRNSCYDAHGCLDPTKTIHSKYYANLHYSIRNIGDVDFVAASEFVDNIAWGILGFLDLKIEWGIKGITAAVDAHEPSGPQMWEPQYLLCVFELDRGSSHP